MQVFALPSLKPTRKAKLTAHDGSKVRKVSFINFRSRSSKCDFVTFNVFLVHLRCISLQPHTRPATLSVCLSLKSVSFPFPVNLFLSLCMILSICLFLFSDRGSLYLKLLLFHPLLHIFVTPVYSALFANSQQIVAV